MPGSREEFSGRMSYSSRNRSNPSGAPKSSREGFGVRGRNLGRNRIFLDPSHRISPSGINRLSINAPAPLYPTSAPRKGHVYKPGPTFFGDIGIGHTDWVCRSPKSPKKLGPIYTGGLFGGLRYMRFVCVSSTRTRVRACVTCDV